MKTEIELDKIPNTLFGVDLKPNEIEALSLGSSIALVNMETNEGQIGNGYVSLERNQFGKYDVKTVFNNKKLEIPKKVLGHSFTEDEHTDLKLGRTVGPLNLGGKYKDVFVKVDTHLNSVTVNTGKEINVPNVIGDYKLSGMDKNRLANNEPMQPRVFKNKGKFFVAEVSLSKGNQGLTFSNIVPLDREKGAKLISEYNSAKYPIEEVKSVENTQQIDKSIGNSIKDIVVGQNGMGVKENNIREENGVKSSNVLNEFEIKSDFPLNTPDVIGNYKLSDMDKFKLNNNEAMMLRVFKIKNETGGNTYFSGNVSFSKDRKGLKFTNVVKLSKDQALKLGKELNSMKYEGEKAPANALSEKMKPTVKTGQTVNDRVSIGM